MFLFRLLRTSLMPILQSFLIGNCLYLIFHCVPTWVCLNYVIYTMCARLKVATTTLLKAAFQSLSTVLSGLIMHLPQYIGITIVREMGGKYCWKVPQKCDSLFPESFVALLLFPLLPLGSIFKFISYVCK